MLLITKSQFIKKFFLILCVDMKGKMIIKVKDHIVSNSKLRFLLYLPTTNSKIKEILLI